MADSITLPRSGLVLKGGDTSQSHWYQSSDDSVLAPHFGIGSDDRGPHVDLGGMYAVFRGTFNECLADLDDRVLALRSALLPPGALVVVPAEAREQVRHVIIDQFFVADGDGSALTEDENRDVNTATAAVLRALGGGK